ncbi:hypothetical protein FRACYDRAFT_244785 [Fragilariopsis cylindrus CCMP1102]|uniref:F-box domain-containing protein n=1 Tax=Fragilariopsis cylindrus CCMP1102 TaxID=635003 RepID=A0A1E7F0Q4_9STRA|nr:hypothetical protein FRACYDRAFT_244785 [Fragilariopsis cylindrus CCMP1102]|eukprot:OEU11666.1 hypothetical protein FRACYDRAFT_244785 [Fragilariopsis cylindrus CCMP1102]
MSINYNEEEEHEEYETESEDDDEADEDKKQEIGTTTASSTLSSCSLMYSLLPDSIRVRILNYLGGGEQCTLDELIDLTVVSKQFYNDCKRPGIEWTIIPTYIINPPSQPRMRTRTTKSNFRSLLRKLEYNQNTEHQNQKCNHYKCIKLNCINEYNYISIWGSWDAQQNFTYYDTDDTPERRNRGNKLILDLSLPSSSLMIDYKKQVHPKVVLDIISCLFRNYIFKNKTTVHTVNLSSIRFSLKIFKHSIIHDLYTLQTTKLIWNYSKCDVDISGYQLSSIHHTIKEFIMNDTMFLVKNRQEYNNFNDLIDEPNKNYIFQGLCEQPGIYRDKGYQDRCKQNGINIENKHVQLERLSIKNAKVSSLSQNRDLPQNALIKFVRNAPKTLKWFHSDLTQGNINMLKKERPDIEFM